MAKPQDAAYKLANDRGLHLHVSTTGFRSWRMKYRFAGKEKLLLFGASPEVSPAQARNRRAEVRRLLRAAELAQAGDTTFKAVASIWLDQKGKVLKERWADQVRQRFVNRRLSWTS